MLWVYLCYGPNCLLGGVVSMGYRGWYGHWVEDFCVVSAGVQGGVLLEAEVVLGGGSSHRLVANQQCSVGVGPTGGLQCMVRNVGDGAGCHWGRSCYVWQGVAYWVGGWEGLVSQSAASLALS